MVKRNWTVLLIGGSSGIGKTRLTKELSEIYKTKIIEADDVSSLIKATTKKEDYPAVHYWMGDSDWRQAGISGNVKWLIDVSSELSPAFRKHIDKHLHEQIPLIMEGDFISADLAATYQEKGVRSLFIYEGQKDQIIENYRQREGGCAQTFRASISLAYGKALRQACLAYGIEVIEARPFDTLLKRVMEKLDK